MAMYAQVSRMLDQNLISSFHRSKEYAAAQAERASAVNSAAAADANADVAAAEAQAGNSITDLADEFDM
jgi:hypothetical protein